MKIVAGLLATCCLLASACSSDDDGSGSPTDAVTTPVSTPTLTTEPQATTLVSQPTAPTAASTTTAAPPPTEATTTEPATTTAAPPTTAALVVPIVVVDGRFLGIGYGSLLPEGQAALPQLGPPVQDGDLPFGACTNSTFGHYWLTQFGGLSLVWEGETVDQAHLTNWRYSGSEVDGVPLMSGLDGVTVGSTREAVLAAYASQPVDDLFDTILVDGSQLRFELDGDTVQAMSLIDCGD